MAIPNAKRLLRLTCVAALLHAWSCSSADNGSGAELGLLAIRLQSAGAVKLESVTYQLTGPNGFVKVGPVAVPEAESHESFGFKVDGLPPGPAYELTLFSEARLVSSQKPTKCHGRSTFGIDPGQSTSVALGLQCEGVAPETGTPDEQGRPNECPAVLSLRASPDSAPVGSEVKLVADVADSDGGPGVIAYAWAAASGSIAGNRGETSFRCTFAGAAAVSVVVSDGDGACVNARALVYVTCTDAKCLAAGNCATLAFDTARAGRDAPVNVDPSARAGSGAAGVPAWSGAGGVEASTAGAGGQALAGRGAGEVNVGAGAGIIVRGRAGSGGSAGRASGAGAAGSGGNSARETAAGSGSENRAGSSAGPDESDADAGTADVTDPEPAAEGGNAGAGDDPADWFEDFGRQGRRDGDR